jgi:putative spermidine/putrescine transport system substrate-binding protein
MALATAGCGGGDDEQVSKAAAAPAAGGDEYLALCPRDDAPDTMVLGVWGGPHEQVLDAGLAEFERKTGIDVKYTMDSTQDRITKLNAEKGSPSIDVALIGIEQVPRLLKAGVIMPTQSDIPNAGALKPEAKLDGGYGVSVLQLVIGYNPDKVGQPPTSWKDLLRPEVQGHLALPVLPNANEFGTLTMLARGHGGSESNLSPGIDAIASIKKGVKVFYPFEPAVEPQVKSGDIWMMVAIAGLLESNAERGLPMKVAVPEEGGPLLMNVAVIPEGVQSTGCSKALVGWLLSEAVQRPYAEEMFYSPANADVTLPDEVSEHIYPKDESSLVDIDWAKISENQTAILDEWNRKVVGN